MCDQSSICKTKCVLTFFFLINKFVKDTFRNKLIILNINMDTELLKQLTRIIDRYIVLFS